MFRRNRPAAGAGMKSTDRREALAEHLMKVGYSRIDDLVAHFGISRMTVHRHIDALARQGVLRKLHGAVTVQPSGLYESAYRYRVNVAQEEKVALARAALDYVEPGQAVMLDDSSTAATLAGMLDKVAPLTVITNSLASADGPAGPPCGKAGTAVVGVTMMSAPSMAERKAL